MQNTRKNARRYYSLIVREGGTWAPQFGDYSLEVVEAERDDMRESGDIKARDVRIIKTGANQADIVAAVARLNAPKNTVTREAKKPTKATGAVLYRGPSLIDGAPVVVVAVVKSDNTKTGDMVQTYIMRDDIDPRDASKTGGDRSICGDCPHRGTPTTDPTKKLAVGRSCYVVIAQGPLVVWKAYKRGAYGEALTREARAALGRGRMVRVGTYGDGAAVPADVWADLISEAEGHTAYSHQAKMPGASFDPALYMVSAESEATAREAWALGRRTFRIVADVADVVKGAEVVCPASAEAGRRATCATCKLCGGASVKARSVAIVAHGTGARFAVQ